MINLSWYVLAHEVGHLLGAPDLKMKEDFNSPLIKDDRDVMTSYDRTFCSSRDYIEFHFKHNCKRDVDIVGCKLMEKYHLPRPNWKDSFEKRKEFAARKPKTACSTVNRKNEECKKKARDNDWNGVILDRRRSSECTPSSFDGYACKNRSEKYNFVVYRISAFLRGTAYDIEAARVVEDGYDSRQLCFNVKEDRELFMKYARR